MTKQHPLPTFVAAFAPLRIAELRAQGGPTDTDRARVRGYAREFGANGDALLYRIKDKTGDMAGKLLDAIAVLAFQPGGVTAFGYHFEATQEAQDAHQQN